MSKTNTRRLLLPALLLLAPLLAPTAHALQKCTRADGRIEYTDGVCPMGTSTTRPNLVENALDGSTDRSEVLRQRRIEELRRQAAAAAAVSAAQDAPDRSRSHECEMAAKSYDTSQSSITRRRRDAGPIASLAAACGAAFAQALTARPVRRARPSEMEEPAAPMLATPMPMPPPQPSMITNCDAGGCWDNLGGRYNGGGGSTFFRSDGRICQSMGGAMQCP